IISGAFMVFLVALRGRMNLALNLWRANDVLASTPTARRKHLLLPSDSLRGPNHFCANAFLQAPVVAVENHAKRALDGVALSNSFEHCDDIAHSVAGIEIVGSQQGFVIGENRFFGAERPETALEHIQRDFSLGLEQLRQSNTLRHQRARLEHLSNPLIEPSRATTGAQLVDERVGQFVTHNSCKLRSNGIYSVERYAELAVIQSTDPGRGAGDIEECLGSVEHELNARTGLTPEDVHQVLIVELESRK